MYTGQFFLGVKILVSINVRLRIKPVLLAQIRDQLSGRVFTQRPIADALNSDGIQIAADGRAVLTLRLAAGAAVGCMPAAFVLT